MIEISLDKLYEFQEYLKQYYNAEKVIFEVMNHKEGFIVYRKYPDGKWCMTSWQQNGNNKDLTKWIK